ncbi:Uncharacterized protein TPAR_08375, partial [Tolypocladium paradoxum]
RRPRLVYLLCTNPAPAKSAHPALAHSLSVPTKTLLAAGIINKGALTTPHMPLLTCTITIHQGVDPADVELETTDNSYYRVVFFTGHHGGRVLQPGYRVSRRRWLVAGVYSNTTQAGVATGTTLLAHQTPSHGLDGPGPVVADGGVELIPSRVSMRCRYAYMNDSLDLKVYRLFMASRGFRYDDWCETVERYVKAECGAEVHEEKLQWVRCDADGKDVLWLRGFIATFELHVEESVRPQCVDKALRQTVPGSMIDWMGGTGCYEAYGFEIEY